MDLFLIAGIYCYPAPDLVCDSIADALRDLRLKTRQFTVPAYTLPRKPSLLSEQNLDGGRISFIEQGYAVFLQRSAAL